MRNKLYESSRRKPGWRFTAGVKLDILDLKSSLYENSVQSFCTLTIFPEGSSEMMSACKARALDEGGMMKTSVAQSWYFWYFLLRPVTLLMKFRFLVTFQALSDLEPSLGTKWRRGFEIHAETMPKPSRIEKMTKSRKTAQNFIIHQIFELENKIFALLTQ